MCELVAVYAHASPYVLLTDWLAGPWRSCGGILALVSSSCILADLLNTFPSQDDLPPPVIPMGTSGEAYDIVERELGRGHLWMLYYPLL